MIRNVSSCPKLDCRPAPDIASFPTSPQLQQHAAPLPEKVKLPPLPPPKVPVPPKELQIAFQFSSRPQMFIRNGTASDPKAAMLGAGAFGAAFLYVQPPPPIDATINQAERSATSKMIEQELLPELSDKGRPDADPTADQQASGPGQVIFDGRTARARSGSVLRSAASLPQLKSSTGPPLDDKKGNVTAPQSPHQSPVNGSYSAVVIKACRSPITGEFDELLRASVRHQGCRAGWHTRVVRGENRILRYIQKARVLEAAYQRGFHLNSDPSGVDNVVKLLADLPADGRSGEQIFETTPFCTQMPWTVASSTTTKVVQQRQGDDHISAAVAAGLCPDGRPPHRMLVFEPLVDLDAEFIDGTWCRTLKPWTVRQVEDAARDTVAGLQFLHAHAVVHADLKPANLMRDPRTGAVKLIDLGGARRFVSLEDQFVNSITVVEERDAAMNSAETEAALLRQTPVAGLTSLTGSPHFMAPEILLQACRYRESTGASRCVLKDYKRHPERLPDSAEMGLLRLALDDYVTGWGTKADIWSWACCVLSFIVRMSTFVEDREVTSLICPFDFVFDNEDDDDEDALYPMHAMRQHELEVPHYHRWARQYPLRIQRIAVEGVCVDADVLEDLSPALNRMIHAAFRHHAQRPTAASIAHVLRSGENKDRRSQAAEAPARTSMMTVDSEATLKDSAKAFSEVGCGSPPPQVRAPPTPSKEPTSRPSRTDLALPKPMVTVAMELDPPVRTCLATAQAIQGTQSIPVPATAATRTKSEIETEPGLSISTAPFADQFVSASAASSTGLISRWLSKVPLSPSKRTSGTSATTSRESDGERVRRFSFHGLLRPTQSKRRPDGEQGDVRFPTIDSWYGTHAKSAPPPPLRTRRRTFRMGMLRKE